ncbi:MAG TPA: aminodeoxychorismate synthase component I [Pyrinomonadaceae bacterium]|nr:aminodeoxychorismate synthase component I [Pyrinomonadaceae bacterium]
MTIRTAERIDDVLAVLEFAEREARAGSQVAVMLSYEAAPAFDPAFITHPPSGFPLAWAAVFDDMSATVTESYSSTRSSTSWTPRVSRDEYDRSVSRITELIAAGDTYQVNYSFPLTSLFEGDAFAWYQQLCVAQGAQYSAYLDLGRYKVLCLSPELFFERRGNYVITRPMKGTVRRGRWPGEDRELAEWLKYSAKDRAENVMIVDLLRNDLGKVSVPGSVRVSSLFDLERFETVWQMTSTVESTLRDGTSLVELMRALFPCGSITGAPKIRTMQIIRELERFPRGAYTGAIGWLKPGGDCVFNVAIRTVVIDSESGVATFGVGGGVTIDSTAERENEECLVKSRFLHSAPVEFQLFESILLEDGEYFLLEDHVARLNESAEYFGFSGTRIDADLERIAVENPKGSLKVRLTLWKDGRIETHVIPVELLGDLTCVVLATEPVDSSDPFLFHKTTRRRGGDNVIFWNERGEVTESSIANVVVPIGGELFTPPIACGLLAGTFRNHLLAQGKIKERVITLQELAGIKELFLINSIRKWQSVSIRG